ncbi:glycosyltransferase family 2 protein [Flavivirga algicola]|uniref:Glycosyltransferase n=1 Tax=Flavivirga algicola TaxID=2729136 RepID=A0ABX1RS25_9FLAO|nr:glycosyltransferase family 2 protein [Flavivirga algicola]NMH86354.1 glycosyltransferase [Flavivirga algicola]
MLKLSIITVNYNNYNGLKRTIESISSQNVSDFEFIIIDGNSTDESVALIKESSMYISNWISEPDNGIYQAMNKGVSMAKGEYLLFLNSGDHLFESNIISTSLDHLKGDDFICFDIECVLSNDSCIKKHPDNLDFSYLFSDTFAHQSTFIKRNVFEKVGYYDESLKIVSDWKFFIQSIVFHGCSYKAIHKTLSTYYLDGISATAEGTFNRREEREAILKNEFSIFYNDYRRLKLLDMNRFKMLNELEHSKLAKKMLSFFLRILLRCFRNKSLKDL